MSWFTESRIGGDASFKSDEPNDIMSMNSKPNGLDPQKVALTDKEKAALLQKCQDLHKIVKGLVQAGNRG